jgi:hypothetical protein
VVPLLELEEAVGAEVLEVEVIRLERGQEVFLLSVADVNIRIRRRPVVKMRFDRFRGDVLRL